MAGENNYLRVPPDSTGKRVRMKHGGQLFYSGKNNTQAQADYIFSIGEFYPIPGYGMVHIHGVYDKGDGTGILEVHLPKDKVYENEVPTAGMTINSDGDSSFVVCTVTEFVPVFINSTHIIGYDNPEHGVDVDATGSMNIRFSEGLPQLDAFGKLRTSGATIIGDYTFSNSDLPTDFTKTFYGRGKGTKIIHDDRRHCVTLTTPDTSSGLAIKDPTTGGATEFNAYMAQMTTNTYHHYFPGFSQMAIMTVALDNNGDKAGVAQKWGYWDDDNGYYFQSVDGAGLEFVVRSSAIADNTIKETIMGRDDTVIHTYTYDNDGLLINTVTETLLGEGWNGDTVNGLGDSAKTLDLMDDNIYWIDIQWLGAGRVRFGTYHKGQRVVIHEYYHDTNGGFPHSQTGSLPIRFQQYNIAGQTVSSSTVMRAWCASVVTEAAVDLATQGSGYVESFEVTFDPGNKNDFQGLNDSGKGDRLGVTKTGCTTVGTTMTVPNITGIKPGFSIDITGGTGQVMDHATTVLEIVDSTTIILSMAPIVDLVGDESVRFHLNVDHEYHLIGLLSPVSVIADRNHANRTLYLPKTSQAWAYHENGDDAFVEVEVYVQPIVSGNSKSITAAQSAGGALQSVEPNNPYAGAESYEFSDGLVNYFGSGFHSQITFVKGNSATVDLSEQYSNYQHGAFKLLADDGGNNRCPIARVYQSPAAGVPTVVQINTPPTGVDFTLHRENETALFFDGIPGAIGEYINASGANHLGPYYVRHLDIEKLELYADQDFTIPIDTSQATTGLDPATNPGGTIAGANNPTVAGGLTWPGNTGSVPSGGFIISGYGNHLLFAIVAKPVGPSRAGTAYATTGGDITVHFKLTWTEIEQ